MDDEDNSPQHDQISLYGLFGDSSTTLQGLNDHLSPSLLQQSPPCGSSTYSIPSTTGKFITTSPLKVYSNGVQQQVFLSDLADRSPSAGSVTVASLCSHVFFDNLRCTNLVNVKGKRFCNLHSGAQVNVSAPMTMKTAFDRSILPSSYLKQTVNFASPITISGVKEKVDVNSEHIHFAKPTLKALSTSIQKRSGVDVPDTATRTISSSKDHVSKFCVVRKVGQQITVTKRTPGANISEVINIKATKSPAVITTATAANTSSDTKSHASVNSQQPLQTVRLNVIKHPTSSTVFPYYKKIEPFAIKTQSYGTTSFVKTQTQSAASDSSNTTQTSNGAPKTVTQSMVVDESTLKKLVDVLNARSDMSTQQQISLLRSMGITVVQAPPNTNNVTMISRKKQSISTSVQGKKVSGKKKVVQASAGGLFSPLPSLQVGTGPPAVSKLENGNHSVKSDIVSSNVGMPAVISTPVGESTMHQQNVKSAFVPFTKTTKEKKTPSGKAAVKRKQKSTDDVVAKKSKSTNTCSGAHQLQNKVNVKQNKFVQKKMKLTKPGATTKSKQHKSIPDCSQDIPVPMLLSSNEPVKLQMMPLGAPDTLKKLSHHLNDHKLLNNDLFCSQFVETESNSETDKIKTVKYRLLKKHIAKRRSPFPKHKPVEYKNCLKDVRNLDFYELFSTSRTVLDSYVFQKRIVKPTVHHEKFLQDLLDEKEEDFQADPDMFSQDVLSSTMDDNRVIADEEKVAYTLHTQRLKHEYKDVEKQFNRTQEEVELVLNAFKENPGLTTQFLVSTLSQRTSDPSELNDTKIQQRWCHLSINNALCCDSPALPYALYCKQHIWHCPSQCLYKLDQNMKPTADIIPEPLVKKVRKRTKLLPLTKKHKKKKRRKVEGGDGQESSSHEDVQIQTVVSSADGIQKALQIDDNSTSTILKQQKLNIPITTTVSNENSKSCDKEVSANMDVSDMEETKPSDTSEEDLHLTGHEIMLNGVFDKLPDDPQDFDLFTTDKGAEELERALLLAASSPTPDHEDNKFELVGPESTSKIMWSPISSQRSVTKVKTSPDAVVVCDTPQSDNTSEQPPSIEDFNQSQCVHYTFGSNTVAPNNRKESGSCAMDNSIKGESFASEEDLSPSLISAEDLQDIEGVLERLQKDADDVNSPKLPSSPAVDQYTNMLARQLSQEAETESLKQFSSSRQSPSPFHIMNDSAQSSLTRTYSLPLTNHDRSRDHGFPPSHPPADKKSSTPKPPSSQYARDYKFNSLLTSGAVTVGQQTVVNVSSTPKISLGDKSQSHVASSVQRYSLGSSNITLPTISNDRVAPSLASFKVQSKNYPQTPRPKVTSASRQAITQVRLDTPPKSTVKSSANKSTATPETPPRKLAKKTSRKLTQTMMNPPGVGGTTTVKNLTASPTVLSNPVVPLTLMQSPSSQHGNVIKVIVPPGTVVNGSGGQQNMLLIPVSALMKSNLVSGNQNIPVCLANNNSLTSHGLSNTSIKTQLSSIQAGQQFFVVNNASASLQAQLALMRKQNSAAAIGQRGMVFKSAATTTMGIQQNIESGIGQKQQINQSSSKQVPCSIKPNVNVYMKQTKNSRIGQPRSTIPPGVTLDGKQIHVPTGAFLKSVPPTTSTPHAKSSNSSYGKLPVLPQPAPRRIRTTAKKVAKAKFDPVTKKYVHGTAILCDVTPTSATTTETLSESMMKVQQIDSVLSSLNSMKNNPRIPLANGYPGSEKRHADANWLVKSVVFPTTNSQKFGNATSQMSHANGSQRTPSVTVTVPPPAIASMQDKANNNLVTLSMSQKDVVRSVSHTLNNVKVDEKVKSVETGTKVSTVGIPNVSDGKNTTVPVSSGTVHWNQTTTAGPQIAPTLTIPVYITGALTAGTWPTSLAINGSIAGNSVPILLPAQKIGQGRQISQRLLLGNIGPIVVASQKRDSQSGCSSDTISSHPQCQSHASRNFSLSTNVGNTMVNFATSKYLASMHANLNATSRARPGSTATSVTAVVGTTMSTKQSMNSGPPSGKVTTKINRSVINIPKANSEIFQAITQTVKSRLASLNALTKSGKGTKCSVAATKVTPNVQEMTANSAQSFKLLSNAKLNLSILNDQCSQTTVSENSNIANFSTESSIVSSSSKEDTLVKKKSGRKASHDTILHDPLMFDPTAFDYDDSE